MIWICILQNAMIRPRCGVGAPSDQPKLVGAPPVSVTVCRQSGGLRVDGRFGDLGKPFVCRFFFVKSLREEVSYVI